MKIPLELLSGNVLVSLTSCSSVHIFDLNSFSPKQSNGTRKLNRKPPPSSQDSGVVDVPGSHYSKPSESSRGSSTDPFSSHFQLSPLGLLSSAI